MDSARVTPLSTDTSSFVVHFNDGAVHRLSVLSNMGEKAQLERQKWINAFQEHAAYSSHYLWGIEKSRSEEEQYGNDSINGNAISLVISIVIVNFSIGAKTIGMYV